MRKATFFIVLSLLLFLCAAPVYANGIPALPHAFYGTVSINGAPAPVNTSVEARGEGVVTGIDGNPVVTTVTGIYGTSNPFEPRLIVQGDIQKGATITFYVNGVSTGQTAAWYSGQTTQLNLSVTIATPTPTPTPTTPGGGGPGGGGGATTPTPVPGTTDLTGLVDANGVFLETVIAYSADGKIRITIPKGTVGKTKDGKPLTEITIVPIDAPSGANTINLLGQVYNIGPDGATFEPSISITFSYDPNIIPEGADMHIHYWDAVSNDWVRCLGCTTDPVNCCVNNDQISHFTPFAVLNVPAPAPTTPAPTTPAPTTPTPTTPAPTTPAPTTPAPTTPAPTTPAPTPPTKTPTPPPAPSTNWPLIGGIIGGVIVVISLIVLLVRRRS